jgi:hypothetical protein
MRLAILSSAEREAFEAAIWLEQRQPGLGDSFLGELARCFDRIATRPESHSRYEPYRGTDSIRRCKVRPFSYLVIYRQREEELLVIAICHGRRMPLYWLQRLSTG